MQNTTDAPVMGAALGSTPELARAVPLLGVAPRVGQGEGPDLEIRASACGGGYSSIFTGVDIVDLLSPEVLEAIRSRVVERCEAVRREMAGPCKTQQTRPARPSNLYLMRSLGLHKIGVAQNVEARRGDISRMSGHPVEVVAFCPATSADAYRLEAEWHAYFDAKRRHGEWFDLGSEDVALFASALRGGMA